MLQKAGTPVGFARTAIVWASLALGPLVVAVASTAIVSAQAIVEAPTDSEIEQRVAFDRLTTRREPAREHVIADLRAEKRALLNAQLAGIEVDDSAIDAAYATLAKRLHMSPEELTEALAYAGADATTLRQHIRTDLAWQQLVRKRIKDRAPSWQE
jgi:peptidyl-prolyl cis-trans isomerase SurA